MICVMTISGYLYEITESNLSNNAMLYLFAENTKTVSQFVLTRNTTNFIFEFIIIFCPLLILNTQQETLFLNCLLILKVLVIPF